MPGNKCMISNAGNRKRSWLWFFLTVYCFTRLVLFTLSETKNSARTLQRLLTSGVCVTKHDAKNQFVEQIRCKQHYIAEVSICWMNEYNVLLVKMTWSFSLIYSRVVLIRCVLCLTRNSDYQKEVSDLRARREKFIFLTTLILVKTNCRCARLLNFD